MATDNVEFVDYEDSKPESVEINILAEQHPFSTLKPIYRAYRRLFDLQTGEMLQPLYISGDTIQECSDKARRSFSHVRIVNVFYIPNKDTGV